MAGNNIIVAIKVRPLLKKEKDTTLSLQWKITDNVIQQTDSLNSSERFCFDHIFDQSKTNLDVFHTVAKPIVDSTLKGFNGTIFAYGQTASGKTYTMLGDEKSPGVMTLAIKEIFKEIEAVADRIFLLRVGYIEIYNEKVYDLFNKKNVDIKIHEISNGEVGVNNTEFIVTSEMEALHYLNMGSKSRKVGETAMNERSSRSHAIFRIIIESREIDKTDDESSVQISLLNLVDLAGSERADSTGASGCRAKEGAHINRSLLSLSLVINKLSDNDTEKFINYRDSKLTRILQASLGGNALTAIICTVNPATIEETNYTLSFATRAKSIKNKPLKNEVLSDTAMMKRLQKKIAMLEDELSVEKNKNSELKVLEIQEKIREEQLKIIYSHTLLSQKGKRRRRTWCSTTKFSLNKNERNMIEECIEDDRDEIPQHYLDVTPLITFQNNPSANMQSCIDNTISSNGFIIPQTNNLILDAWEMPDKRNKISFSNYQERYRALEIELEELKTFTSLERKLQVDHSHFYTNIKTEEEYYVQINNLKAQNVLMQNEILETQAHLKLSNERAGNLESQLTNLSKTLVKLRENEKNFTLKLNEFGQKRADAELILADYKSLQYEFEKYKQISKARHDDLINMLEEKNKKIDSLEAQLQKVHISTRETSGLRRTLYKTLTRDVATICNFENFTQSQSRNEVIEDNKIQNDNYEAVEPNDKNLESVSLIEYVQQDHEKYRKLYFQIQSEYEELSSQLLDCIQDSEELKACICKKDAVIEDLQKRNCFLKEINYNGNELVKSEMDHNHKQSYFENQENEKILTHNISIISFQNEEFFSPKKQLNPALYKSNTCLDSLQADNFSSRVISKVCNCKARKVVQDTVSNMIQNGNNEENFKNLSLENCEEFVNNTQTQTTGCSRCKNQTKDNSQLNLNIKMDNQSKELETKTFLLENSTSSYKYGESITENIGPKKILVKDENLKFPTEIYMVQDTNFEFLKKQNSELEKKLSGANERSFSLQITLDKLYEIIQQTEEDIQYLRNCINVVTQIVLQLSQEYDEFGRELVNELNKGLNVKLKKALLSIYSENHLLKISIKRIKKKNNELENELVAKRNACENFALIVQEKMERIVSVEETAAKLQAEINELKYEFSKNITERMQLTMEKENIETRLQNICSVSESIKEKHTNALNDIQNLQKQIQESSQKILTMQTNLSDLQGQSEKVMQDKRIFEEQKSELAKVLTETKIKVFEQSQTIASLKALNKSLNDSSNNFQAEKEVIILNYNILEKEYIANFEKVATLEYEVCQLENTKLVTEKELEKINIELNKRMQQMEILEIQNQDLAKSKCDLDEHINKDEKEGQRQIHLDLNGLKASGESLKNLNEKIEQRYKAKQDEVGNLIQKHNRNLDKGSILEKKLVKLPKKSNLENFAKSEKFVVSNGEREEQNYDLENHNLNTKSSEFRYTKEINAGKDYVVKVNEKNSILLVSYEKNHNLSSDLNEKRKYSQKLRRTSRQDMHDEVRELNWSITQDIGIMTDPTDSFCNCLILNEKINELKRNLRIKDCQINTFLLESKNDSIKNDCEVLRKMLMEEEMEKKKLDAEINKLKATISMKCNEKQKLNNQFTQTEKEIHPALNLTVNEEYKRLQGKYDDLKKICRYRNATIQDLENKLPPSKKELHALKQEYEKLQKKYDEARMICIIRADTIKDLKEKLQM